MATTCLTEEGTAVGTLAGLMVRLCLYHRTEPEELKEYLSLFEEQVSRLKEAPFLTDVPELVWEHPSGDRVFLVATEGLLRLHRPEHPGVGVDLTADEARALGYTPSKTPARALAEACRQTARQHAAWGALNVVETFATKVNQHLKDLEEGGRGSDGHLPLSPLWRTAGPSSPGEGEVAVCDGHGGARLFVLDGGLVTSPQRAGSVPLEELQARGFRPVGAHDLADFVTQVSQSGALSQDVAVRVLEMLCEGAGGRTPVRRTGYAVFMADLQVGEPGGTAVKTRTGPGGLPGLESRWFTDESIRRQGWHPLPSRQAARTMVDLAASGRPERVRAVMKAVERLALLYSQKRQARRPARVDLPAVTRVSMLQGPDLKKRGVEEVSNLASATDCLGDADGSLPQGFLPQSPLWRTCGPLTTADTEAVAVKGSQEDADLFFLDREDGAVTAFQQPCPVSFRQVQARSLSPVGPYDLADFVVRHTQGNVPSRSLAARVLEDLCEAASGAFTAAWAAGDGALWLADLRAGAPGGTALDLGRSGRPGDISYRLDAELLRQRGCWWPLPAREAASRMVEAAASGRTECVNAVRTATERLAFLYRSRSHPEHKHEWWTYQAPTLDEHTIGLLRGCRRVRPPLSLGGGEGNLLLPLEPIEAESASMWRPGLPQG